MAFNLAAKEGGVMEELKVIMETLGQLGESGQTMFLWWIAKEIVQIFLTAGVVSGALYGGYILIKRVMAEEAFIKQLVAVMGYSGGHLTSSEKEEILEKLRRAQSGSL